MGCLERTSELLGDLYCHDESAVNDDRVNVIALRAWKDLARHPLINALLFRIFVPGKRAECTRPSVLVFLHAYE